MGRPSCLDRGLWANDIEPSVIEYLRLTWAEVEAMGYGNEGKRRQSHRLMPVDKIRDEAQTRLLELHEAQEEMVRRKEIEARMLPYVDSEDLFRFRLGNLPRLWGFRMVNFLYLLWYDPEHEIYPIEG
jgi:hypothetical protein